MDLATHALDQAPLILLERFTPGGIDPEVERRRSEMREYLVGSLLDARDLACHLDVVEERRGLGRSQVVPAVSHQPVPHLRGIVAPCPSAGQDGVELAGQSRRLGDSGRMLSHHGAELVLEPSRFCVKHAQVGEQGEQPE